jgi:hypothetical protein
MISVPQLIAASIAASLSLGIVASYATSALGKALHKSLRKAKIVQGKSGKNHYTLAPSSVAKAIACDEMSTHTAMMNDVSTPSRS